MPIKDRNISFAALLIAGLLSTSVTHACCDWNNGKFAFQLGAFNAHQGKAQQVNITGLIGDYFSVTSHNDTKPLLGFGYYVNGPTYNMATTQIGLNGFYLPDAGVGGIVTQEAVFNNLSYGYNVSNYPILLDAKAEFRTSSDRFTPTFDIGIGPSFAQTSNFVEHSLDGITIPDNIYSGATSVNFGATVGVGVKFNNVKIYRDSPLECGYRFFYLGEGSFKKANNQVNTMFKTGNGYANALLCSVAI